VVRTDPHDWSCQTDGLRIRLAAQWLRRKTVSGPKPIHWWTETRDPKAVMRGCNLVRELDSSS